MRIAYDPSFVKTVKGCNLPINAAGSDSWWNVGPVHTLVYMESSHKLESMPTFCRSSIPKAETTITNEGCGSCNGRITSSSPRVIRFLMI